MEQQGLESVKTTDIRKGMYVILPLSWHEHPFLKNQFIVKSDADIEKIKTLKVREIKVDPARYENMEREAPQETAHPNRGKSEAPQKVVPDALKTAIRDTQATPERKAAAIRQESVAMMKR
jgi:hypothetical protein